MATYTRQSSFSDGDTITAALFNNEFNQLVNAFNVSSGHTHDGSTTGDGGPLSTLYSNTLSFGTGADTDIAITFNANSNDGVLTWMEDEDYFKFSDDLLIDSTEKVQFRDTAIYIYSSADGQLDLVADTEIQIAATTIDMNGAADISGNLAVGGNLTVTGNATISGNLTFGDAASDTVAFSADVASHLLPSADNTYDLGASGSEWKDLYIDGVAYVDAINFNGTAISATAAELNIMDGVTATAAELNILDGVTSTAAELNILDGVTSTAAELNILDGVTSTAAELNILDGVTSTAAELNILDGVTASATDINLIDGITNGTVIASKAIITDANKDITGGRNITISGELDAATLDISGDADIDGTLEADAITIGGTTLAETISDTVGAMVTSNTESGITVAYDDSDNTLDFTVGTLNQDTTGTAATVTGAAQSNITSLGTLTTLTVDNVIVNGTTIGHTDDTDLMTLADGVLTVAGEVSMTTLDIGGTNVTSTAAELNILDGVTSTAAELNILDGVTSTAAELNILDGVTSTAAELNILDGVTSTAAELNILDGATVVVGELNYLDLGSTAVGTAIASKGVVLDSNKDYTGLRNLTITGELDAATLDISGDVDVDGTLEADAITVNGTALASVIAGTTVANATLAATTTVADSTANTNFPVVFHDESNGLLDDTGALRYNPSTGELLVPKLTVAGTTTTADTVTMQASNAIIFEGATADAHETTLSIVDPTADHTQYLINQGGYIPVLAAATTTAITSTPAELNILDGVTSTATELNLLDGSTANTVVNSKAVVYGSSGELAGTLSTAAQTNVTSLGTLTALTIDNVVIDGAVIGHTGDTDLITLSSGVVTVAGEVDATSLDISGDIDVDGTANLDVVDIDGAVDMASTLQVDGNATFGGNLTLDTGDITISNAGPTLYLTDTDNNPDWQIKNGNGSLRFIDATNTVDVLTLTASGVSFNGTINSVGISSNITNFSESMLISNDAGTGTLSSADNNTGFGYEVFDDITTGDANTAVGRKALTTLTTGSGNTAVGMNSLLLNTTGSDNTAVGARTLDANTTGAGNVAVGEDSLSGNTTGDDNVAIGQNALKANTEGQRLTAVGQGALAANTTADSNSALGRNALGANTTGHDNTAVGRAALGANTTAADNTAVGAFALDANTTGDSNTAVGKSALTTATTADDNTAVGFYGLGALTTGAGNTALGKDAGQLITTGNNNVAIGLDALESVTTAADNVAVGYYALQANTGAGNTAVGRSALAANTTADYNTAVGYQAGDAITTGDLNVAVGKSAMGANTVGDRNVAIGANSLQAYNPSTNEDGYNVAVGLNALFADTTGKYNTAVGGLALDANTTADYNTALGYNSLSTNSTGAANTAVGFGSLQNATTAANNVAIGGAAMQSNTTGAHNTAVGAYALDANTTADQNTSVGYASLTDCTTGANNTAIGDRAGEDVTTGSNNTVIGKQAGANTVNLTTGGDNTFVGAAVRGSGATVSNEIAVGFNFSAGGANTARFGMGSNTATLSLDGSDTSWAAASDERLKENIEDSDAGLDFINELRAITYKWKPKKDVPEDMSQYEADSDEPCKGEGKVNHGFVAQEVKAVIDKYENVIADGHNIWSEDPDGTQQVAFGNLMPMMVKAVQELSAQVEELKSNSHAPKGLTDMEGYDILMSRIENLEKEKENGS